MREFDLVIERTAGKENLLADALSRKHKYSLDPTEEQEFILQSIDPTEDNRYLQDTSITTNNLSISPVPVTGWLPAHLRVLVLHRTTQGYVIHV